MIQATKPTFSFGVLLLIALGLVGAVLYFNQQLKDRELHLPSAPQQRQDLAYKGPMVDSETSEPVSTADWQKYSDPDHDISFKYPDGWEVKNVSLEKFDVIVIQPDQGKDHIRIYVSASEYAGLAGLRTSPITVGGIKGLNAADVVIGVKQGPNYFTFDAGTDQRLLPEFQSIIKTVAFK